jgi:hypothetical protein
MIVCSLIIWGAANIYRNGNRFKIQIYNFYCFQTPICIAPKVNFESSSGKILPGDKEKLPQESGFYNNLFHNKSKFLSLGKYLTE